MLEHEWSLANASIETAACELGSGKAMEMSSYDNPDRAAAEIASTLSGNEKGMRIDWLPAAAEKYNISASAKDYVAVPVIVLASDLPNRNLVAFPRERILEWDVSTTNIAYRSMRGVPMHLNHCFPADAPVLSKGGEVPIASLRVGDKVMTHAGRYRRITRLFKNGVKSVRALNITGYPDLMKVTDNHPLEVVDARQVFAHVGAADSGKSGLVYRKSALDKDVAKNSSYDSTGQLRPHWRAASDVYVGDYLRVPSNVFAGKKAVHPSMAYLMGVYAAEGSLAKKGNYRVVHLTISARETDLLSRILAACKDLGYATAVSYRNNPDNGRVSVANVTIKSRALYDACLNDIGVYSDQKRLGGSIRDWNAEGLTHFLAGYVSGDGYVAKPYQGRFQRAKVTSVSRKLCSDIFFLSVSLGMSPKWAWNSAESREVSGFTEAYKDKIYTSKPSYHVCWHAEDLQIIWPFLNREKTRGKALTFDPAKSLGNNARRDSLWVDGKYYVRVRDIKSAIAEVPTFNIEVEKDHSYVAYGAVVHNCNSDPTIAKGVVFDVGIRRMTDKQGGMLKIIALAAIDRGRDPILANKVLTGEVNTYSMGAMVRGYHCSICGCEAPKPASPACAHIPADRRKLNVFPKGGLDRLAYWNTGPFKFFELSALTGAGNPPAFASAETRMGDIITLK